MMRTGLTSLALASVWSALFFESCQTQTVSGGQSVEISRSFQKLKIDLLSKPRVLSRFSHPGPFLFQVEHERILDASHPVTADIYIPVTKDRVPLVILVHGNRSRKEAHGGQAERLASWGLAAVTLQLPNQNHWLRNGHLLGKITSKIASGFLLSKIPIERSNIILAGHSFGGSAVTLAAARGAPVRGIILLDPAVVHESMKESMQEVRVPTILLGADQRLFRSRKRRYFYRYLSGPIGEVSIIGATHDDAQLPSMFSLHAYGFDPFTSEEHQSTFAAALTASAFSLAAEGSMAYAWKTFVSDLTADGLFKNKRRRRAKPAVRVPAH